MMTREEILAAAKQCVCGGRESDYGTPEDSFGLIGQYWTVYTGHMITAKDVAMMMALLKIARIQGNRATGDCFVDLAGYAACGGELEAADRIEAQAKEIDALRNELCLKCGKYTLAHEGACNGCRWRR